MYHLLHCLQPILLHESFWTPWHIFFCRWTLMTHNFVRSRANSCTSFLGSMHKVPRVPLYLLTLKAIICFFVLIFFIYDLECFSFLVFLLYPESWLSIYIWWCFIFPIFFILCFVFLLHILFHFCDKNGEIYKTHAKSIKYQRKRRFGRYL